MIKIFYQAHRCNWVKAQSQ